jgi:hypothetical protein
MNNEYLKLARLMEQEHAIREKLRALQAKVLKGGGRFTCTERIGNGLIISIPLADMMARFPEAKTEWKTFPTTEGGEKGYMVYGPECIGELRPNFYVWIRHETKTVVIQEDKPQAEQEAA